MIKRFFFITMLLCGICLNSMAQEFVIKDVEDPSLMCEGDLRDFMYAEQTQSGPSKVRQFADSQGNVVTYRDRITNMPEYLIDFVDKYVEAGREVLNGGSNWLSDPTVSEYNSNGYYYLLKEVTGTVAFTFPAGSGADVIKQAAADAYKGIADEEYDILQSFLPYAFLIANYDHPEFFWIGNKFNYGRSSGSSISYSPSGTGTATYSIKLLFYLRTGNFDIRTIGTTTYNFRNTTNLANGVQSFNNYVQTILEQCQEAPSRYDKLMIAHDWLTQHNSYNYYYSNGIPQSQLGDTPWSPYSALEGNNGQQAPVCEGYSRAFKVLCDLMDIPCILMSGNAHFKESGGGHMWNYVQMENGAWYAIDVTWDDPAVAGVNDVVSGQESHDWFLLGSMSPLEDGQTFIESHPEQWYESYYSQGSYIWDLLPGPLLAPYMWTPPIMHTLTYIVDGEIYKTYEVEYNMPIIPEPDPVKEGYTFSGWGEIPEIMPDHDVIVTGSFIINSYTLTYMVDGEEYKIVPVLYGTPIIPEPEPEKEGYTFSGWSEIPETMPASDLIITGSFIINQYTLTYVIDTEEYKSYVLDYNTPIIPEPDPYRRGMLFCGWDEIPETMPAHDVIVTGTFTWLQEMFDGIIYQVADTLKNSATVIGNDAIAGEVEILSDVEIGGDVYSVTRIGKLAFAECVEMTSVSIPATVICIEDSAFSACPMLMDVYCYAENVPMTYNDVFVNTPQASATLHVPGASLDIYKELLPWSEFGFIVSVDGNPILGKCASPVIVYKDGRLTFRCDMEEVEFNYDIADDDIGSGIGNEVILSATYTISVYAFKTDYENSDTIQATLCWIDQQPVTEGVINEDAIMEVKALPILIQAQGGIITLQGLTDGTPIAIYGVDGKKYGTTVSDRDFASVATSLRPGSVAIIKIGEKTVRVLMK